MSFVAISEPVPALILVLSRSPSQLDPMGPEHGTPPWYLRDAAGVKVRSRRWRNYLMDPLEAAYVSDRAWNCHTYFFR